MDAVADQGLVNLNHRAMGDDGAAVGDAATNRAAIIDEDARGAWGRYAAAVGDATGKSAAMDTDGKAGCIADGAASVDCNVARGSRCIGRHAESAHLACIRDGNAGAGGIIKIADNSRKRSARNISRA